MGVHGEFVAVVSLDDGCHLDDPRWPCCMRLCRKFARKPCREAYQFESIARAVWHRVNELLWVNQARAWTKTACNPASKPSIRGRLTSQIRGGVPEASSRVGARINDFRCGSRYVWINSQSQPKSEIAWWDHGESATASAHRRLLRRGGSEESARRQA